MGKLTSHNTLVFVQGEGSIAVHPQAPVRLSKYVRNNDGLSWEEMLNAGNTMLRFVALSGVGPKAHAELLAYLY